MESHKMSKLLQPTVTVRPSDVMVRRWHHRSRDPSGFPGLCLLFTHANGCCREQVALGGGRARCRSLPCLQTGLAELAFSAVCCWRKAICRSMPLVRSSRRRQADYKTSTFPFGHLRPENQLYSEQHFDTYFPLI